MHPTPVQHSVDVPLAQRAGFITAVVLLHVAVLGTWTAHPHISTPPHEMAISMVMPANVLPQTAPLVPELPPPLAKPQRVEKSIAPSPALATPSTVDVPNSSAAALAVAAPTAPALPDREPDFSASYLNNPKPIYPLAARRMGWQGKVIVRVEVLATGAAGEVSLYQSSGREALDNAALAAVKSWRFTPARVAGQLITKTFLVPIPFKLESDSE